MIRNILFVCTLLFSWSVFVETAVSNNNSLEMNLNQKAHARLRKLQNDPKSNINNILSLPRDPDKFRLELKKRLIQKGYKKDWESFWLIDSLPFEWQNWFNLRCRYTYTKEGATINFKWQEIDRGETEKDLICIKNTEKIRLEKGYEEQYASVLEQLTREKHQEIASLLDSVVMR